MTSISDNMVKWHQPHKGEKLLVFLPGISGGAHSERFDFIDTLGEEAGYDVARLNIWENSDVVQNMTIYNIHQEVSDFLFGEVWSAGYRDVTLVGKSFGGFIALISNQTLLVKKKILWAPAIGVGEGRGTLYPDSQKPLSDFAHMSDIKLGEVTIGDMEAETHIIHGTADDVIPLVNSQHIVDHLQNGSLTVIEDADHSFKTPPMHEKLVAATRDLLQ